MADYRIELSRRAARDLRKLDAQGRARIDRALRGEARRLGSGRRERGGKRVKRLRGQRDEFLRLRLAATASSTRRGARSMCCWCSTSSTGAISNGGCGGISPCSEPGFMVCPAVGVGARNVRQMSAGFASGIVCCLTAAVILREGGEVVGASGLLTRRPLGTQPCAGTRRESREIGRSGLQVVEAQ
jgi:mRNA-degrading endonuclease RelE of RelBE toxin-antitoxin system